MLPTVFQTPVAGVQLEIGFGGGEHLIGRAAAEPDQGFLGCEAFVNGMAKMLSAASDAALSNIRVHFGDAAELLPWLPDASLSRVYMLYPDPWPKRRHWKRRFVQPDRIHHFARVMKPGAEFRFASDWADYADWTLSLFRRSDRFAWTAEHADDWRVPWTGHVCTRYESKALRAGRESTYLTFQRL